MELQSVIGCCIVAASALPVLAAGILGLRDALIPWLGERRLRRLLDIVHAEMYELDVRRRLAFGSDHFDGLVPEAEVVSRSRPIRVASVSERRLGRYAQMKIQRDRIRRNVSSTQFFAVTGPGRGYNIVG